MTANSNEIVIIGLTESDMQVREGRIEVRARHRPAPALHHGEFVP